MKFVKREVVNDQAVITVGQKFLFWKREIKYVADEAISKRFWNWLKLPSKECVADRLSFQLDAWNMSAIREGREK